MSSSEELNIVAVLTSPTIIVLNAANTVFDFTKEVLLGEVGHTEPTNIDIVFHAIYTANI